MSGYLFLVSAQNTAISGDAGAPDTDFIYSAFSSTNDLPVIRFVGPAPRITRTWYLVRGTITRAVQPVKVDDPSLSEDEAKQIVAHRLLANLTDNAGSVGRFVSGWNTPEVVPYNQAISGPISAWISGAASRSQTVNDPPSALSTGPADNPYGPNDPGLRPQSPGESLEDYTRHVGNAAKQLMPVLYLAAGALALAYVAPFLLSKSPKK